MISGDRFPSQQPIDIDLRVAAHSFVARQQLIDPGQVVRDNIALLADRHDLVLATQGR